jgi:hypothetical protein
MEYIQTLLLLIILERLLIERPSYKLGIDFKPKSHISLWIYHKERRGGEWQRCGGKLLLIYRFKQNT